MRKILPILIVFIVNFSFSQEKTTFNQLIEAEAKAASKRIIVHKVNINTANYDVTHHKLEFTIDPAVAFIDGVVTTTFTAKENMSTVTFDLADNMSVSKVSQNGVILSYTQNTDDELLIVLTQMLPQGQETTVKISYSGNPKSSGFGSFEQETHNGSPIVWTLSEPYGAMGWWPCKQDLNDKIDAIDVYITAPKQYVAVSNGLEQSQVVNGANRTTHFKHNYPIPAYLIAFAVANYKVYSHTVANNGNPFDIVNYVYPENLASAQNQTKITVDIMNLYTELFAEYPYADEKYGHAQFGWGGGMEHTTVSFMGGFSRDLIAHELAHQWFGDKITCGSWKDIWLNESFATYLTGLTVENLDGLAKFKNWRVSSINSITSQTDGAVYLSDQDTTSVRRIFNGRLSYRKGAMVLHMLRKKIGDAHFFQSLKNYLADPNLAYGYAKTPDLIAHLEAESGESLAEFFKDWIYSQGYPSYTVTWHQPQANELKLIINQKQSHNSVSFFEALVPIRVYGAGGEVVDFTLNHTTNGEALTKTINFKVTQVEFDPDSHLISKNNIVSLGIQNLVLHNKIILYPNPASAEVYIQKPNTIFIKKSILYNAVGQKVAIYHQQEKIHTASLKKGIYFLKIETNKGDAFKTFLKQ